MTKEQKKLLWPLFKIFFMAGTFTFTGGLAMIPIIEKDVVEKYEMMDDEQFIEYASLSQTLPGVIAVNCASYVGKHAAGVMGMLVASLGATISAFVIMLFATMATQLIPETGPIVGAMNCIRAASAALILSAAFTLGAHNLKSVFAVILMLAAFSAVFLLRIETPLVVIGAGIVGYIYHKIKVKGEETES